MIEPAGQFDRFCSPWRAADGRIFQIRPIQAADEPLLAKFHEELSEDSIYLRYAQVLPLAHRTAHERLHERCTIDYARQFALVAIDTSGEWPSIAGIGRLSQVGESRDVEFAVLVRDADHHHGLGTKLLSDLIVFARETDRARVVGHINALNLPMLTICQRLGFQFAAGPQQQSRTAILALKNNTSVA
jgi:acetyltransferase